MIDSTVSHYRITEKLGGGGMGVVYRGVDTHLGREVALKFLPGDLTEDPEARRRFKIEARAASALDHTGICTIYDVDETSDGRLFIVMALYDGETLKGRLLGGPLPIEEATDIGLQMARALARAHEQKIVHRDIKPANVMITDRGEAKIVDFGLAKLMGVGGLTRTGASVGTLAYMAPEQADAGEVGPAADLWALGVVLYEMLTGRSPFARRNERETLAALLALPHEPVTEVRPEVSPDLSALVDELLAKAPAARPASAEVVATRLADLAAPPAGPARGRFSAVLAAIASLALLGVVVFAVLLPALRGNSASLIPEIEQLAADGRFDEAYLRAVEAEDRFGADSVAGIMSEVADVLLIETTPVGAEVTLQRFDPEAETAAKAIGPTPIEGLRVSRGEYLVRIEREGYQPVSRVASSELFRPLPASESDPTIRIDLTLHRVGQVPPNMITVPGGEYELASPGLPVGLSADLERFFLDEFEVTNEAFRDFVVSGAYRRPDLWPQPFVVDDVPLSFEDGVKRLVDRTGLPGPRDWRSGRYQEGEGRHPVAGVTWYEAAAYCAFVQKRLPTAYEWEKAARNGVTARSDIMMPWGYVGARAPIQSRANFSGSGTAPVDRYPFGLSPFGAHGMAGNVREWLQNGFDGERFYTGGSFEDPPYIFGNFGTAPPFISSPAGGFRCAVTESEHDGGAVGSLGGPERQGAGELDLSGLTPQYEPVTASTFASLLSHFRYDSPAGAAAVVDTIDSEDWTRLRIEFPGPDDERIPAYLYLPKRVPAPYQTLVYVPGSTVWQSERMSDNMERLLPSHIRAGRAVFAVVVKGMNERKRTTRTAPLPTESVAYRDEIVEGGVEFRLGLDYLESRGDIDMEKLAYIGHSRGAASRLAFAGIDERLRAFVLTGAGIDERMLPTSPEVSPVTFAPYLRGPKLVVNGTRDEEHPWLTRGLPLWNLLSEPKTLELVEGAGHSVPEEIRIPMINRWLDQQFGPVG